MESSNNATSTVDPHVIGKILHKELDTLELLIIVTLVLVVCLLIFQVFTFLNSKNKNKKNLEVPTAVVIAKKEGKSDKKEKQPKSNGSQKIAEAQNSAPLPSKTVMVELDVNERKEKEKKIEDLPPVVAVPLEAPPAYQAAAKALLASSSNSEKVSNKVSAPSISTAQIELTSSQTKTATAIAITDLSNKEVSTAKAMAVTQNSATVDTTDVKTATGKVSAPDVTADLKTANPQASTPKVPPTGDSKVETAKTATPTKTDKATASGMFGIFKK